MIPAVEPPRRAPRVNRLTRFAVTTSDTDRLLNFWVTAFDCREISRFRLREGGGRVRLALGAATIDILEFDQPGRPYPPQLSPFDNEFQHFAIVVSDMASAYARLCATHGWSAVTASGPQRLPDTSGDVLAFKFRDPDGHPLEFLDFPLQRRPPAWHCAPGGALFQGIDHSAVSVSDAARSIAFYQSLGLQVVARSYNHGVEQQLLDGVPDPHVDVIALAPAKPTPHVELLCYRNVAQRRRIDIRSNDVFASRLIFESDAAGDNGQHRSDMVALDPDGHLLEIHSSSAISRAAADNPD